MMKDRATLVSRFRQMVNLYGDRMALSAGDTSWTYREFDRKSDEAAAGLLANGAEAGMKIGLWTGETPEAMTFYMAILKTGTTAVMLNTSWVTKSTPSTMRSQTPTLRGLRPRRTLQT